jgi:hypothetical protein
MNRLTHWVQPIFFYSLVNVKRDRFNFRNGPFLLSLFLRDELFF